MPIGSNQATSAPYIWGKCCLIFCFLRKNAANNKGRLLPEIDLTPFLSEPKKWACFSGHRKVLSKWAKVLSRLIRIGPILIKTKRRNRRTKLPEIPAFCYKSGTAMAHPAGFEPTAFRLGGGRSILLSYGCRPSKTPYFQGFLTNCWVPVSVSGGGNSYQNLSILIKIPILRCYETVTAFSGLSSEIDSFRHAPWSRDFQQSLGCPPT